jgi:hypothetical protein
MHSVGLYNGRYGFSQFVVRTQTTTSLSVPHMYRPLVDAVLEHELARQARLKSTLARRVDLGSSSSACSRTTSSSSSSTLCRSIFTYDTRVSGVIRSMFMFR